MTYKLSDKIENEIKTHFKSLDDINKIITYKKYLVAIRKNIALIFKNDCLIKKINKFPKVLEVRNNFILFKNSIFNIDNCELSKLYRTQYIIKNGYNFCKNKIFFSDANIKLNTKHALEYINFTSNKDICLINGVKIEKKVFGLIIDNVFYLTDEETVRFEELKNFKKFYKKIKKDKNLLEAIKLRHKIIKLSLSL